MKFSAPAKKAGLIANLIAARRSLLAAAASVPPEKQDEAFLGAWSLKDLLAHLQGWDVTNLAAVQALLAGQLPDFYACYDADWATYNAHLVAQYRQEDFSALREAVEASHAALIDFLNGLPASEFDRDRGIRSPRGADVTVSRLLEAEARDEKVHAQQVRAFAERAR